MAEDMRIHSSFPPPINPDGSKAKVLTPESPKWNPDSATGTFRTNSPRPNDKD